MAQPTKKQKLLFATFKEQMHIYGNAINIDDRIHTTFNKGIGISLSKGNLELKISPEHGTRVFHILEEIIQLARDIERN